MGLRFGVGTMGDIPLAGMVRRAQAAEDLGYDHLWIADERLMRNVYAQLTLCALQTQRIGLGTCVTNPYTRTPAITAAAIATVDEASGRRAVLGLGAGGGLDQYGVERVKPARAMQECTAVVRMLTAGQRCTYSGELFRLKNTELNFKPLRQVPVYWAARGPMILELAGQEADGVIIGGFASPPGLGFALGQVKKGLRKANRPRSDLEVVAWLYTSVSDRSEVAQDAVRWIVVSSLITSRPILDRIGVKLPPPLLEHLDRTGWTLAPEAVRAACPLLSPEILDMFSVAGTPAEVARKLERIAVTGVDQLALVSFENPTADTEVIFQRIAHEVIPALR